MPKDKNTHVAAAIIKSMVLDLVNKDDMDRYRNVDAITITIRTDLALITLHITTGNSKRSVRRANSIAFAAA